MSNPPRILPGDPKASYLAHKAGIDDAVGRVIQSGRYILGTEVTSFEREFAAYLGAAEAIGVGSGTDAIHLALRTLGVGPGDGVVTVSHTAVATVAAIELAGAEPLLVDIDPSTFTMDVRSLEAAIASHRGAHLKAIVPVHLYGHPADMPAIVDIARRHRLFVIEDCAQAHGAAIGPRKIGTWGDIACFSFYPTKNLGALGDAGALVTDSLEWTARARMLRQYGWRERYISEIAGLNTRLDELQAAVLRAKLPHLDRENARRREIAAHYDAVLESTRLDLPRAAQGVTHVYHQYTVRTPYRDELAGFLNDRGIGAGILYPLPVHVQAAYRERHLAASGGLTESERVCRELLCLPVHPQLTDSEVAGVAEQVVAWCRTTGDRAPG
jgi:dTDP-4-amino-4,6-dideoxygalactose transaminase